MKYPGPRGLFKLANTFAKCDQTDGAAESSACEAPPGVAMEFQQLAVDGSTYHLQSSGRRFWLMY